MQNRIHTISVKNFKAFDEQEDFFLDGKHVLIYGENGSGKPSLFWALYTLLQASVKGKNTSKYFDRTKEECLLNIHTEGKDDVSFVKFSLSNDPGKFYTLSTAGLDPSGSADSTIGDMNLASDFVTHRLLTNFYNFRNSQHINLFQIFLRDIFPFLQTGKGKGFLESYNWIVSNKPLKEMTNGKLRNVRSNSREYYDYLGKIRDFNENVTKLLNNLNEKASTFYKKYFSEGKDDLEIILQYSLPLQYDYISRKVSIGGKQFDHKSSRIKDLNQPNIKLSIRTESPGGAKDIDRPQSFLNEAKLTAIALSIRFAILDERPVAVETKFLALDDLLISLDMSNRERALNLVLQRYAPSFQLIMLTHDPGFFSFARQMAEKLFRDQAWVFLEMFIDDSKGYVRPRLKPFESEYARAVRHLQAGDYKECAHCLRTAIEFKLQEIVSRHHRLGGAGAQKGVLKVLLEQSRQCFVREGFDIRTLDDIELYKDALLNPASHFDTQSVIYRNELRCVFALLDRLNEIRNDGVLPVDSTFQISLITTDGTTYCFSYTLRDDLRLCKKSKQDTSHFSKVKAVVTGCNITKPSGEQSRVNCTYDLNNKSLEEVYAAACDAVKRETGKDVVVPHDVLTAFVAEGGKELKSFIQELP